MLGLGRSSGKANPWLSRNFSLNRGSTHCCKVLGYIADVFCSANVSCVEVLGKVPGKWAAKAAKAAEVLNLYHYFNSCEEEPCRSHADPGLVTVLGRSTLPGLQAVLPVKPGGAPGRPAVYEDHWCDLEPLMDELGQGQPNWREHPWGSWPRSSEISGYPSLSQVPEVMKSC